jgi:NAD(P)-dependent dehydrogenase (short-subunit alcohol dehydrogenase family)
MNCVGYIQHGMWTHPRDRSTEYNTIQYWQDLARLAERGKFDGIFLADIVGAYDVYRGGPAPSTVDGVDEIAATCLFLVSEDAGFITGQTIHVNGGAHCY